MVCMSLSVLSLICFVGVFRSSCTVIPSVVFDCAFTTNSICHIHHCSTLGETDLCLMHNNSALLSVFVMSDQVRHGISVHLSSPSCHLTPDTSSTMEGPGLIVAEVASSLTQKAVVLINNSLITFMSEVSVYG